MKKFLAILILLTILASNSVIMTVAQETEPPRCVPEDTADTVVDSNESDIASTGANPLSVPRIDIHTENGNGASLLKADGYVNAQIAITDTDSSVLSGDVLFKVRGNSTAIDSIQKKGFTFKFNKKAEVLGMGKGKKWALLANCFDPTLLRNFVMFEWAKEMGLPYTSEQCFVELWLDDEYRGCYTVYELVQEGKDRVDIDVESNGGKKDFLLEVEASRVEDDETYITVRGHRFIVSEPEEPNEDQIGYITGVMADMIDTMKGGSEAEIRQKIDLDSFAAYYLLNEYAKTADFGFSSVFFFYKDGKLYAGPPWDYDLSLGNLNGDLNSASAKAASKSDGIMQSDKNLYRYLCGMDWFQAQIRRVYYRHYDYIENISADGGLLDQLRDRYADVFARNFGKWRVGRWWLNYQKVPFATYEENFDFFKTWCVQRNAWLSDYYDISDDLVICGDADSDGYVSIMDATVIQRRLAELPTPSFDERAADVDGDGLDITDATKIQRYLAEFDNIYHINELLTVPDPITPQPTLSPFELSVVP